MTHYAQHRTLCAVCQKPIVEIRYGWVHVSNKARDNSHMAKPKLTEWQHPTQPCLDATDMKEVVR